MYAIRCRPNVPALPDDTPQPPLWLVGSCLGVSSNPAEARRFTLDEADKMKPTLNTCEAVGTTTRFSELWAWEVVPESVVYAGLPRCSDRFPFRCRFLVNRRPHEWVQYHPDLASAEAAFRKALAQEYRGCSTVSGVVVDAVPVHEK